MIFKGTLDPAEKLISVDLIRLSVDQAIIEGDGFLEFEEAQPAPAVRMRFLADNLTIPTLMKLWPPVPYSGGRTWVNANVPRGTLKNLEAEVAFTPDAWTVQPLPDQAMHITMDFTDGEIHFLRQRYNVSIVSVFNMLRETRQISHDHRRSIHKSHRDNAALRDLLIQSEYGETGLNGIIYCTVRDQSAVNNR